MKKILRTLMGACMACALASCSGAPSQGSQTGSGGETKEWTREGYYTDANEYMLSVTYMDDVDEPGWYVGAMLGEDLIEDSYGGMLEADGNTLHGSLPSSADKEALTVTVSEEGEDGLQLAVEGGETYHFEKTEMPEASIIVTINTEGQGNIAYTEGDADPEIDPEYPYQSAQINLGEPAGYTFLAYPDTGNLFVKWTKNGEDYSEEPRITVDLDESADFVAVFENDPDWQNPVMNFVGNYQCDRANALVECFEADQALITIEWAGSASELARWTIIGKLDTETLTISYEYALKEIVVYEENGETASQETEYEDGTGTIVFNDDGTFTWHDDMEEREEDMVFEFLPVTEG